MNKRDYEVIEADEDSATTLGESDVSDEEDPLLYKDKEKEPDQSVLPPKKRRRVIDVDAPAVKIFRILSKCEREYRREQKVSKGLLAPKQRTKLFN